MRVQTLLCGLGLSLGLQACLFEEDSYSIDNISSNNPEQLMGDPVSQGGSFATIQESPWVYAFPYKTSSFSIDVDGASYNMAERWMHDGLNLPTQALRVEEFVNYFDYTMTRPSQGELLALDHEISTSPWDTSLALLRLTLRTKDVAPQDLPPSNIVLLVDVSGSMSSQDKLPMLIQGLQPWIDQLRPQDRISLVTYAGSNRVLVRGESGSNKSKLRLALEALQSGGGTAGASGIKTAYEIAQEFKMANGNNRVILYTDGDFNVGPQSNSELETLIQSQRSTGILLSVIGVGTGNLNEATMQNLANKGNGNYEYAGNAAQLHHIFVERSNKFHSLLIDVKSQVDFDTSAVEMWRLIGYENRKMSSQQYNQSSSDGGEMSPGQGVTALYELKLKKKASSWGTFSTRYKNALGNVMPEIKIPLQAPLHSFASASPSHRLAASVAASALVLRDSPHKGTANYASIFQWTQSAVQDEPGDQRDAFLAFVRKAQSTQN